MRISYRTNMHFYRLCLLFLHTFFAGSRTVCCFYHDFLCFCWTPGLGYLGPLATCRAAHKGGQLGHFAPGPLTTYLKDRYTLIEQSALIKRSQYSSEEQCSKLINKEIWLVKGRGCHCKHVMTFFLGLQLTA